MTDKEKLESELIKLIEQHELLLEMAYPLKDIYRKIDDQCEKVIKHLLLCLLFGDKETTTLNHWKEEIAGLLYRTYFVKGTNKYPTEKQLNINCFNWKDTLKDTLDTTIELICHKEKLNIPNYYKDKLYNCIINYFKWLYKEFSIKGQVKEIEVFNKIDSLIKEYNK